jgi:hypothetical protein
MLDAEIPASITTVVFHALTSGKVYAGVVTCVSMLMGYLSAGSTQRNTVLAFARMALAAIAASASLRTQPMSSAHYMSPLDLQYHPLGPQQQLQWRWQQQWA